MTALCVIVRHGNTFAPGEPARRIGARTDLPLVESGRAQALGLGAHFVDGGWRFDRIMVSPLRRAQETAALVLSSFTSPPDIEICSWLDEIDHGPDENRPEADVVARIGQAALARWDRQGIAPADWHVDGETRREAWHNFFLGQAVGVTLLVTSNGAARFGLLATEELAKQAAALPSLKLATGAYGVIATHEAQLRLVDWNRRS